ncbi:MAG: hypothetical protein B6I22_13925 [Desulfobacteraceae bacterium 4572_123]|nr:MAG: hypothetical protein B6I22_13925 [Desulfobacteraceae bacterium 4572_123]
MYLITISYYYFITQRFSALISTGRIIIPDSDCSTGVCELLQKKGREYKKMYAKPSIRPD